MIDLVKKLYWQKYRPKNIDAMILLPRIQKQLLETDSENQTKLVVTNNLLLTGSPGTGKTSLAKLIVPKGALTVNASYNSSVEDLKDTVMEYCRTSDIFGDNSLDGFKIVFLDEFDGVSAKYQDALRGFIEDWSDRIRFIATCNNLTKVSPAMQSRFTVIKFDPQNNEETKYLQEAYLERAELVAEKNKLNVNEEQLRSLINLTFPDLRSVMNSLQDIEKTGSYVSGSGVSLNVDLYNLIFTDIRPEKTYEWVMENYGDKVENLIKICGRPLAQYIFEHRQDMILKVPRIMGIVNTHANQLVTCIDPMVLALSMVYQIQETVK